MSAASFLVLQGIDQGARYELDAPEVGIGRGGGNAIRLHDTEVSRAHATVSTVGGAFVLTDLNSSNGTFVNGKAIRTKELRGGDQVQFGRTVMLFAVASAGVGDQSGARERVALVPESDPAGRSSIVGMAAIPEGFGEALAESREGGDARPDQLVANLQLLYRISEETVRPTQSLDELLGRILELTLDVCRADRGCVLLRDAAGGELIPRALRFRAGFGDGGDREDGPASKMPVPRSIVDYVLRTRQGVRTSDARQDARFTPGESVFQAGVREVLCVPMQGRYELLGVIYVDITTSAEQAVLRGGVSLKFTEDQLRVLVSIGRQAALAVEDNRYRQALVKSERLAAVGQTIAILSHHIKNILQGVRGGSYLIDLGLTGHNEDLIRKGWGIVDKNQEKIYHLVMDLLTLGKERQPALRPASVQETVADVVELMRGRADEIEARLVHRPGDNLPPTALIDAEGIHRAVLNIVTNALDAVEESERREVEVVTRFDEPARAFVVTVRDSGPGIPPDRLGNLFNLFESTKGSRGTGIGLAVSRKIVREHGGDITVVSHSGANDADRGACFTIEIPFVGDESPGFGGQTIMT